MAAEGRFFVAEKFKKSQNRNGFGSFFVWGRCGDKQKKHKQKTNWKNNRGWGKIRHFVGVEKIKRRGQIYDIQN